MRAKMAWNLHAVFHIADLAQVRSTRNLKTLQGARALDLVGYPRL
jgi:hypothetical protein